MVTGTTGGSDSPSHESTKRITEGKFAPKLSIKSRYTLADGKPFEKKPYIKADIKPLNVDQDICFPPSTGDTPNWNIVGDNRIKKVFKIEIGNMPDDQIEDYIKKVAEKFKKAVRPTPDLDCGIYKEDEDYFIPTRSKMPEQPDLQKIHDALYPKSSAAHYMHVIPNSHFWTDLKQIVYSIELELQRQKYESEKHPDEEYTVTYVGEHLSKDYILIGLGNSLMHGYNLKLTKIVYDSKCVIFVSVEDMIEYTQSEKFNLVDFKDIITNTINIGINLTNGIKMEREHVYKRIDAERKYQDLRWNSALREGDVPDEEKPVAEWLNYIEYHLSKAKDCNYHLRKDDALEELRKVAALAVRAMEIHGCPERRMPDSIGGVKVNKCDSDSNCDCKK